MARRLRRHGREPCHHGNKPNQQCHPDCLWHCSWHCPALPNMKHDDGMSFVGSIPPNYFSRRGSTISSDYFQKEKLITVILTATVGTTIIQLDKRITAFQNKHQSTENQSLYPSTTYTESPRIRIHTRTQTVPIFRWARSASAPLR